MAGLAGFAVAAALPAAFIRWERRTPTPMLDLNLFRIFFFFPRFTAASATVTVASFSLFGFIFLMTQSGGLLRLLAVHAVFAATPNPLGRPLLAEPRGCPSLGKPQHPSLPYGDVPRLHRNGLPVIRWTIGTRHQLQRLTCKLDNLMVEGDAVSG